MGFDDFFEDKRKQHGNYNQNRYHDEHRYSHDSHGSYNSHDSRDSHGSHDSHGMHGPRNSNYGQYGHFNWLSVLEKIKGNRQLKLLVVIGGIVILIIAVGLIIILLPLIIKIFNYISQNGLQSILEGITGFIDKLWKGSGK
ncbi:MAG: hypothetical protein WCK84_04335 [Bacteroidota bacterium]